MMFYYGRLSVIPEWNLIVFKNFRIVKIENAWLYNGSYKNDQLIEELMKSIDQGWFLTVTIEIDANDLVNTKDQLSSESSGFNLLDPI